MIFSAWGSSVFLLLGKFIKPISPSCFLEANSDLPLFQSFQFVSLSFFISYFPRELSHSHSFLSLVDPRLKMQLLLLSVFAATALAIPTLVQRVPAPENTNVNPAAITGTTCTDKST